MGLGGQGQERERCERWATWVQPLGFVWGETPPEAERAWGLGPLEMTFLERNMLVIS